MALYVICVLLKALDHESSILSHQILYAISANFIQIRTALFPAETSRYHSKLKQMPIIMKCGGEELAFPPCACPGFVSGNNSKVKNDGRA